MIAVLHPAGRTGITPAHAGKSNITSYCVIQPRDHPRPRGEKTRCVTRHPDGKGSPPPTRGKGCCHGCYTLSFRITPAHAGKSVSRLQRQALLRDHPRPRGEKTHIALLSLCVRGSPPPTRGKASMNLLGLWGWGITPAHAGKSPTAQFVHLPRRDHPRPRGEKHRKACGLTVKEGSPPPTRGKEGQRLAGRERGRITPAHAGKSIFALVSRTGL